MEMGEGGQSDRKLGGKWHKGEKSKVTVFIRGRSGGMRRRNGDSEEVKTSCGDG